jgi:hypothetical protein
LYGGVGRGRALDAAKIRIGRIRCENETVTVLLLFRWRGQIPRRTRGAARSAYSSLVHRVGGPNVAVLVYTRRSRSTVCHKISPLVGATGLVGQSALTQALADPRVSRVVALTRRPLPPHPKLENPVINFDNDPTEAP